MFSCDGAPEDGTSYHQSNCALSGWRIRSDRTTLPRHTLVVVHPIRYGKQTARCPATRRLKVNVCECWSQFLLQSTNSQLAATVKKKARIQMQPHAISCNDSESPSKCRIFVVTLFTSRLSYSKRKFLAAFFSLASWREPNGIHRGVFEINSKLLLLIFRIGSAAAHTTHCPGGERSRNPMTFRIQMHTLRQFIFFVHVALYFISIHFALLISFANGFCPLIAATPLHHVFAIKVGNKVDIECEWMENVEHATTIAAFVATEKLPSGGCGRKRREVAIICALQNYTKCTEHLPIHQLFRRPFVFIHISHLHVEHVAYTVHTYFFVNVFGNWSEPNTQHRYANQLQWQYYSRKS